MAHDTLTIIDEHAHFTINKDRSIDIPEGMESVGVQGDHNCERITFDCFRYYDGHDLSKCEYIYINYFNLASNSVGIYIADDATVDETDTDIIHFSWLISANVTDFVGDVAFTVSFKDLDDNGNTLYSWNSLYNAGVNVQKGLIVNTANYEERYPDALAKWLSVVGELSSALAARLAGEI